MTKRFAVRETGDDRWKVVYTSTGTVVTLEGSPLDDLDRHRAEECLGLLEAGELVPDPSEDP
ncbi:hypothetical protein [Chelativorans sp. M5D2P16]|uniref:hypothetical protein n=1 Tax=Chelativorans sp. M5D2P16 TaxID=3095678 RepID=UPI002ACA1F50|nr:hypothetical protein [Chelativorans sp. M5D2P16]MDZ5699646.1 hypothetical protein [Chelativorans sp. M5D2P16]